MKNKGDYTEILTISATIFTIFFAFLVQAIIPGEPFSSPFFLVAFIILFGLGWILIIYGFRCIIGSIIWQVFYSYRLRKRKIGILYEEKCKKNATSFSPKYWFDQLIDRYNNVDYVSFSNISDGYTALINPYGEFYVEEDYVHFKTFNRLREYVQNGGIVICAGGIAFYWAWRGRRESMTGDEIGGFSGDFRFGQLQQNIMPIGVDLIPTLYPGVHSLKDTLLYKTFRMRTTINGPQRLKITQTMKDRAFCGDIIGGGRKEVFEFRAAREPLPECYPLLRTYIYGKDKSGNKIRVTLYPLVAVPDGRGFFIFGGMAFDYRNRKSKVYGHKGIAESQIEMILKALDNLIEDKKLIKLEKLKRKKVILECRIVQKFFKLINF